MIASKLSIEKTIIHEITARGYSPPKDPELILSNALSPLDDDLRAYFRERIAESLRLAAFPVKAKEERSSPTPDLVHLHFTDASSDFVDISKQMAQHLFAAQQKVRSSSGLLVVIAGKVESGSALVVLKLQKHQGLNLERTGAKGAETYNLDHLRRLMLTDETRVYKIALFEADGVLKPDDVYGEVSDKQRFSSPEKRMAAFFLDGFLGCELRDDPTQMTNSYYVTGEKFLNEKVVSPEKRARFPMDSITPSVQRERVLPRSLNKVMRRGELQALRASDIDLGRSEIAVQRSWDQYEGPIAPKSKAGVRTVPILAVLRDYLDVRALGSGSDLVFGRGTDEPFAPKAVADRAKTSLGRSQRT